MHRFGERLMLCLSLVSVLAGACGDDDSLETPNVDAGTGADVLTGTDASVMDAAATMLAVTIPSGATGRGLGAYSPNPAVVAAGTTVMWMNEDSVAHTATSTTSLWDSGVIPAGGSFSRTFTERGTFPYFCAIHGAASMSGTIVVQ